MSFNLSDVLKDVSKLDTSRDQIEYIRLEQIDSDPNNFYLIEGIEELAANISLCGLQQPPRVRQKPEEPERYVVVSGHRRRAALELLAKDDQERWDEIPCIVDRDTVSPALQQLRLIYANANTRRMTSAELGEQAAQVEKLLYQLKEEGYEFPGRMRDHVAEAVNASKTKIARLKVIREGLAECWMTTYKNDIIGESTAYELAHMPREWQDIVYAEKDAVKANLRWLYADDVKSILKRFAEIDKLKCEKNGGAPCQNRGSMLRKAARIERYYSCSCTKCCESCDALSTCKMACSLLADKVKQLRAEQRDERQQKKMETEVKERPVIDYIRGVYDRVGKARKACGASVRDLYKAEKVYYAQTDDQKQSNLESGNAKITTDTTLPFGYNFRHEAAERRCAVADLLGCSIDYLLGRDVSNSDTAPAKENVSNSDTGWRTGTPPEPGDYAVYVSAAGIVYVDEFKWNGSAWFCGGSPIDDDDYVFAWAYPPKMEAM